MTYLRGTHKVLQLETSVRLQNPCRVRIISLLRHVLTCDWKQTRHAESVIWPCLIMGYAPLNDHWIANNVGKLLWLSSNFWGYLVPSVSYCQIINPIYQIPILYLYDIIIFLSFPIYFFHFLGFCQVAGLPSPSRLVASRQQWGPNWELHTARATTPNQKWSSLPSRNWSALTMVM